MLLSRRRPGGFSGVEQQHPRPLLIFREVSETKRHRPQGLHRIYGARLVGASNAQLPDQLSAVVEFDEA